jgi:hypothetical protein
MERWVESKDYAAFDAPGTPCAMAAIGRFVTFSSRDSGPENLCGLCRQGDGCAGASASAHVWRASPTATGYSSSDAAALAGYVLPGPGPNSHDRNTPEGVYGAELRRPVLRFDLNTREDIPQICGDTHE